MKTISILLLGLVLGFASATAIGLARAAHEWDTSHDDAYRRGKQEAERELRYQAPANSWAPSKRNPC
jgi:hypothetical protein